MATPVKTDKWAGNFDCTGECGRKRLVANEFSKSALERYRRSGCGTLRCKQCVAKAQQVEQEAARQKQQSDAETASTSEFRVCVACKASLKKLEFNKNQWNKGEGMSRCRACVEKAVANEAKAAENAKAAKLQAAKEALETAQKSGSATAILKAESVVAALEAEKVTGLKPVRIKSSVGRGRGASSRRGRR